MKDNFVNNKRRRVTARPLECVVEEVEEVRPSSPKKSENGRITRKSATGSCSRANHSAKSANNTDHSKADDKSCTKYILSKISRLIPDGKKTTRGHETIIRKLQVVFYKCNSSSELASEYQRNFARTLFRTMIVPFKLERSHEVDRIIQLFTKIIVIFGTDENRQMADFPWSTVPLFFRILKLLSTEYVHYEDRHLVRLRVIELIDKILDVHNSHPLLDNDGIRNTLRELLSCRIRDKYGPVRSRAVMALRFFISNAETRKTLKYSAMFDPHVDVRRNCVLALKQADNISPELFYKRAFDRSPIVGIEAFKVISSRLSAPGKLPAPKMHKLLQWGLKHHNESLRKFVVGEFLPECIQANNGILNFLKQLDLSFKPRTTACILDGIIKERTEESFAQLDKGFLNEDKLIPIEEISIEKMIYWTYLCKAFKDKKYCLDKLLPSASVAIQYLESIIEKIHDENEQAEIEEREEEVTYLLCLSHALRIASMCALEESTRRHFVDLLQNILVNPILDEAPLLIIATDTLREVLKDHERFQEIITTVVQQIFDPTQLDATSTTRRRHSSAFSMSQPKTNNVVESDCNNSFIGEEMPNFHPVTASTPLVTRIPKVPIRRTELKDEEKCQLKEKLAALGYRRNKLIGQRDFAKNCNDFLEAGRVHDEIATIQKQEHDLRDMLGLGVPEKESSFSNENKSRVANKTAQDLARTHDSILRNETSKVNRHSDVIFSQPVNSQSPKISDSGLLRGIVISTRFLVWHQEVIPCIRQFVDNEISRPLLSEDSRVRINTLQLLCMFAQHDKREARKVMTAQLRALALDTPDVRASAFKCIVDLLLNYKYEDFKYVEGNDIWADLPDCLNDVNASEEDLENFFISKLNLYLKAEMETTAKRMGERETDSDRSSKLAYNVKHLEWKVEGLLKLLLRGAVTINAESLIAQLFRMWADPLSGGTEICSRIAYWLPIYCYLNCENAKKVAKGLVMSLTRILCTQRDADDDENGVKFDHALKLFELVFAAINSTRVKEFADGNLIHTSLAFDILELIVLENEEWEHMSFFGRLLNRFDISEQKDALKIVKASRKIIQKISLLPKTTAVSRTKTLLVKLCSKLNSKFDNLPGLNDLDSEESDVDSRGETVAGCVAFSDSDAKSTDIFENTDPPYESAERDGRLSSEHQEANISPIIDCLNRSSSSGSSSRSQNDRSGGMQNDENHNGLANSGSSSENENLEVVRRSSTRLQNSILNEASAIQRNENLKRTSTKIDEGNNSKCSNDAVSSIHRHKKRMKVDESGANKIKLNVRKHSVTVSSRLTRSSSVSKRPLNT